MWMDSETLRDWEALDTPNLSLSERLTLFYIVINTVTTDGLLPSVQD